MTRKFLNPSANKGLNLAVMILAGLALAILTLSIINARESIPPISLIITQTGLFCLIVPSISHGAFAGERERRSWDLLLVAPIRKSQIVVGKLYGALTGIVGTALFFLLPIVITSFSYRNAVLRLTLLAELESLTFAFLLAGVAFAISSRAKRAFAALGGTVALLVFVLAVLPFLTSLILDRSRESLDTATYLHPFFSLWKMYEAGEHMLDTGIGGPAAQGAVLSAIYFGVALALLAYTVRSLEAEDGDGRFRLKRKHA